MTKECPIDFIQINENKVRLNALVVFILVLISLFTAQLMITFFLAFDFFLRGFNFGKYSLINKLSDQLVRIFKIPYKAIDQGPKRFAAKIGFLLSVLIIIALLNGFVKSAIVLGLIFSTCAFLESFLGICLGCYMYTFLRQIKFVR